MARTNRTQRVNRTVDHNYTFTDEGTGTGSGGSGGGGGTSTAGQFMGLGSLTKAT